MKELDKDIIKQIILDFDKFQSQDVWMTSFEDIVGEFVATQSDKYLTGRNK